jgi:excisionase family DNA binding protein
VTETSFSRLTVTVPEAAKALGVGLNSTYGLISAKRLKAVKLGRKLVIPRTELEAFLRRETAQEAA